MPACPRLSPALVAFLLAGALVGLLTLGAGRLTKPAIAEGSVAFECVPFPDTLDSTSELRFTALAQQAVHLDVDSLEIDRDIFRIRQLDLAAGATAVFAMPTYRVGIAIQVIASAPVQVEAAVISDDSAGVATRHPVPCTPITQSVRGGGP